MINMDFKKGQYVKVSHYRGIIFYVVGKSVVPNDYDYDDELEFYDDFYDVCMVGDDRIHTVDVSDIEIAHGASYCFCGQEGCGWNES